MGRSHISVTQEFLDLEVVHAACKWSGEAVRHLKSLENSLEDNRGVGPESNPL